MDQLYAFLLHWAPDVNKVNSGFSTPGSEEHVLERSGEVSRNKNKITQKTLYCHQSLSLEKMGQLWEDYYWLRIEFILWSQIAISLCVLALDPVKQLLWFETLVYDTKIPLKTYLGNDAKKFLASFLSFCMQGEINFVDKFHHSPASTYRYEVRLKFRDVLQISLLILSKFKRIHELLSPLPVPRDHQESYN